MNIILTNQHDEFVLYTGQFLMIREGFLDSSVHGQNQLNLKQAAEKCIKLHKIGALFQTSAVKTFRACYMQVVCM